MSCEKAGIGMTRRSVEQLSKKEVAARNASENWIAKGKGGKKIAFHGFNAAYITRKRRMDATFNYRRFLIRSANAESMHVSHECAKRESFLSNTIFRSTQIRSSRRLIESSFSSCFPLAIALLDAHLALLV